MRPKADNRHDREKQERTKRACRHARSLPPSRGSKHHERKHKPGGGLHADPDHEQGGCRAEVVSFGRLAGPVAPVCRRVCRRRAGPRVCRCRACRYVCPEGDAPRARGGHRGFASRQRQRPGQDEQHERVVVSAADGKPKQHGIQADEHGCQLGRASHHACSAGGQGHRRETARDSHQLESPQATAEPERGKRIGAEREQGPIGRMLERPADERKDGVGRSFGCDVRVGI
jgi:hypothetical protein